MQAWGLGYNPFGVTVYGSEASLMGSTERADLGRFIRGAKLEKDEEAAQHDCGHKDDDESCGAHNHCATS
jgi:hypothetical protein